MSYLLSSVLTHQSAPNKSQRGAQSHVVNYYARAGMMALIGFAFMLSACQKPAETKTELTVDSNTMMSDGQNGPQSEAQNTAHINDETPNMSNDTTANPDIMTLNSQQPRGTQVTDVYYRSKAGETLTVVFQTSATGILNAVITLSDDTTLTLSAPEGQGNNPTYRSADGKIALVSHQGGAVIDLIREDTMTSFTAVSAEAEVITQT